MSTAYNFSNHIIPVSQTHNVFPKTKTNDNHDTLQEPFSAGLMGCWADWLELFFSFPHLFSGHLLAQSFTLPPDTNT